MSGLGAGYGPLVHGAAQTGVVDTGWGGWGGLLGVFASVTIFTLGADAAAVSLGTLGEGAGKSGWKATAGAGRGAVGAGAVGGIVVMLGKRRESVWMAAN